MTVNFIMKVRPRTLAVGVVGGGEGAEAGGGGLGGEVALGHAEHLEAVQEFADLGGTEQRGVEVGVEVIASWERFAFEMWVGRWWKPMV